MCDSQGNMCTAVKEMWALTVFENIKKMLLFRSNDGIVVVFRKNPFLNIYVEFFLEKKQYDDWDLFFK